MKPSRGNLSEPCLERQTQPTALLAKILEPGCIALGALPPSGTPKRPLRSFDEPWGLPSLQPRHWRQVMTGTDLVYALIDLLVTAATLGLSGFMEHPAFPCWRIERRPCSIWSWQAVKWLAKMPCTQVVTFDQCIHGAPSRKPTTILTVRLPWFRELVQSRGECGRCPHRAGHAALIGKDQQGKFKTEQADTHVSYYIHT